MTVVCALPNLLKELKAVVAEVTEAAVYGDLWQKVHEREASPVPLTTFGASIDDEEKTVAPGRSPNKLTATKTSRRDLMGPTASNRLSIKKSKPTSGDAHGGLDGSVATRVLNYDERDENQQEKGKFSSLLPPEQAESKALDRDLEKDIEDHQPIVKPNERLSPAMVAKQAAAKHPKLVTFELPSVATKVLKEPIDDAPAMENSGLSKLLGSGDVEVYLPGSKTPITVKVVPTASIAQLVQQTIKVHNATKSSQKLEESHEAYNVRISQENGQIDDMFPALAKKGTVDQWANVGFILVDNPHFKKSALPASTEHALLPMASQTSLTGDKLTIRITLPSGAYHTLLAEPSLKIGKLLGQLCEKRQLVSANYTLTTADKDYLSSNMRVSDLKDLNLVLEMRAVDNGGAPSVDEVFWNESVAVQFKLFNNVIYHYKSKKKFNTANAKQDMVSLGIDGEKVVITILKKGGATIIWPMSDLRSISVADDNPVIFTIETWKEKDKFSFETTSKTVAKEIAGKLSYLIDLAIKNQLPH